MKRSFLHLTVGAFLGLSFTLAAADWPQWRGPDGQGHADAKDLPVSWSEKENIAWKRELPGRGWSSPVIMAGQVWMTSAVETAAKPEDAARRTKENKSGQNLTVLDAVSLHVLAVDLATGEITHDEEVLKEREPQWVHELNSYASPTPVIEAGRLYAHFGTFGTACVDTNSGSVLWRNTDTRINHENGPGSSPVLWNDLLIFHCDGSDKQFVCALDKNTGKLVWKTDRTGKMHDNPQYKKAYGTPLITDFNGKPVMVSTGADWVYGYEPATGKELWKVPYGELGFSMAPRPVAGHGMVFFSTAFMKPEMFGLKVEGVATPEVVWHNGKNCPSISSPLLVGGELYYVNDGGIFSCVNAKTGTEYYRERLNGKFTSSPLLGDGHIYVCSREGVVTVLKPGQTFEVLAKNQLDGAILSTPAAIDGALLIRTDKALYRVGKK